MISDRDRRAYLLGAADLEITHIIELDLLRGGEELECLERLEDELIDDYVFGCLPDEESLRFFDYFLCTLVRKSKLNVASELRLCATSRAEDSDQTLPRRPLVSHSAWRVSVEIAACVLSVICIWLGVSNNRLRLQLLNSRHGEAAEARPVEQPQLASNAQQHGTSDSDPLGARAVEVTLIPTLTRSIQHAQLVRISPSAAVVLLTLESLNESHSFESRLQVFDAEGRRIWSQDLLDRGQLEQGKARVIAIPTAILVAGDYQLRVAAKNSKGNFQELDSYSFRVLKD